VLRRQNIEHTDKSPYLIVAGWGDEFVRLSCLDGASCAIYLDKVAGLRGKGHPEEADSAALRNDKQRVRRGPHLSDDEAVAKMGHPN